jgi:succinoglycan biosynthesis transport protein ExoP
VVIVAVLVSVGIGEVQHKKYTASAQLLVQPAGSASSLSSGIQQTISATDMVTELQLLYSAPIMTKAATQLGFYPSITGSEVGQTDVLLVSATASTPTLAQRAANTYANDFVAQERTSAINALLQGEKQYQTQINALNSQIATLSASDSPTASSRITALASQLAVLKGEETQLQVAAAESPGGVEITSLASLPTGPSSPHIRKQAVIALVVGLLLGLVLAFLVDYLDDRVYTKEGLEGVTAGVPVLTLIPKIRTGTNEAKVIALEEPFSPVVESYRSLRAALQFVGRDAPFRAILITSAGAGEGKTSTAANLGVILANAGKRVVLVDCDLRRPRLGAFLGLQESPGLTSILEGHDDLTSAVQPVPHVRGLSFIGTGPLLPNASEWLGSTATAEFFDLLRAEFDVVLIDTPPLLLSDAVVLSNYADAILLVVAAGQSKSKDVQRALKLLRQTRAIPAGIVLNKVPERSGKGWGLLP